MSAQQSPPVDMRPEHWAMVQDILRRHAPDCDVWAFGSRARHTAKPYSDLDLALRGAGYGQLAPAVGKDVSHGVRSRSVVSDEQ